MLIYTNVCVNLRTRCTIYCGEHTHIRTVCVHAYILQQTQADKHKLHRKSLGSERTRAIVSINVCMRNN